MSGEIAGKGYDIHVPGVNGVLKRVESLVKDDLTSTATSLAATLESAIGAMDQGQSNVLAATIAAFRVSSNAQLNDIAARASLAASGCVTAVNAYAHGDRQMAANAARNTTISPKLDHI